MAANESDSNLSKMQTDDDNDSDEEMETDVLSESKESDTTQEEDVEEGELSDSKNTDSPQIGSPLPLVRERTRRYENKEGGFIAGVDVCGEEEQSKLGERAKRFGLDPSTVKPITDKEVKRLHASLGMTTEEGIDKSFRLDALHMRGTEDMSTKDVFAYFRAFGPASVEWINDFTCNVVWLEELSATRALLGLSTQIKGLEKLHKKSLDSPKETEEKEDKEEIVVTEDESDSDTDSERVDNSTNQRGKSAGAKAIPAVGGSDEEDDAVDADTIKIPIPPGKWRVGVTHPKAKNILLRYATRSDKKHPKAEKLSEYYKKYGNPNYGGLPGLLTESRKRRYRRNDHLPLRRSYFTNDSRGENEFRTAKNPWGSLAKNWGNTGNPELYGRYSPPRKMPQNIPSQVSMSSGLRGSNSQKQFGRTSGSDTASTYSDDDKEMATRTKVPRMRMYADEEEIKIEKRKAQRSKQTHEREDDTRRESQSDLRHRLRRESRGQSVEKHRERDHRERGSERSHSKPERSHSKPDRSHLTPDRSHSKPDRSHSKPDRSHSKPDGSHSKLSSTVWSRLRHRQSRDDVVESEVHDVERKHKMKHASDKKIHSDDKQINADDSDDLLDKPMHLEFGDLRSKLNSMKTVRQKSPLRIEIDNDEYYRVIGSGSDE